MTGKRCRVMICDDQGPFRELVAVVLALDDEIDVVGEAVDGREAVALIMDLQPDVLLLDVAMPRMDGLEALPLIRSAAPQTKVAMLTGITSERIRDQAFANGAVAFIEKGADVAGLADQVKRVWRGEPR